MRGVPVHDAAGHIIKWFGTCTDIHDLKLVEADRIAAVQRLSLAIAVAKVGVWDWELSTNTLTWDATMFDIYGFTPIVPMEYRQWAAAVHPDDLPGAEAILQRVIKEKGEGTAEFRIVQADGSMRHVAAAEGVILDAQMHVSRVVGVNVDVTERRDAEAAMRTARDAAEQANRAKSEFLANMSHEIRTPMNGVIGMTDIVLHSALSVEQRQQLGIVKSSAGALLGVINDILDFSKVEAGRMVLDPVFFAARDVIDGAANTVAWQAHAKGLGFVVEIDDDVPRRLDGDAGRLRQILVNLLGNAIKFTERGEVELRVTREGGSGAGAVVLHFAVRDTGIGIPLAHHQDVFRPFTQADGSITRAYGGTGLGLTIASQLATLMGGRLWMDSEAGRGSTFHFTARFAGVEGMVPGPPPQPPVLDAARLPVVHDRAVTAALVTAPLHHRVREAGEPARILVVAGHVIHRLLTQRLLEKRGHSVAVVDNRLNALTLLTAGPGEFDCVLVDMPMAQPDAENFVASIRERERTTGGHLPIVGMVAPAMTGDDVRGLETGIDGYVSTPIQPDELYATIERCLDPQSDDSRSLVLSPSTTGD
jgi:PAS domain S-box-containing protein